MAKRPSAGDLRESILCQKRVPATDEFSNPVPDGGAWTTQFCERAGLRPRIGGETALAGRLQGIQPYIVTIRQSSRSRQITPGWRLVDARNSSRIFNVRSIVDPDGRGQWLELLVEEGAAT